MESLNSTVLFDPRFSTMLPSFSNKFPAINRNNANNSARIFIHRPRKLLSGLPHPLNLAHSRASIDFRITAHFRKPERRQNYLRKKLTEDQHRRKVSSPQNPFHEFNKNDGLTVVSRDSDENLEERSSLDNLNNVSADINEPGTESVKKHFADSIMWNKLENWVEQYKKDSEFWGIGTGPIFIVYQDSKGKVERVVVNEDEIMRRGGVNPGFRVSRNAEDLGEVNFKMSFAKDLAKEMEVGSNRMMNSSVVKFVSGNRKSNFMESIRGVKLETNSISRISRAGILVLSGLFVVWAMKGLFAVTEDSSKKHTKFEKEMLRRKMKVRKQRENLVRGSVEVIQDPTEFKSMPVRRPLLDKEKLLNSITRLKGSNNEIMTAEYSDHSPADLEDKIKEIRAMARHARDIEERDPLLDIDDEENGTALNPLSSDIVASGNSLSLDNTTDIGEFYEIKESNNTESSRADVSNAKSVLNSINTEGIRTTNDSACLSDQPIGISPRTKLRVITSIKEAREYLSRKDPELEVDREIKVGNDEQFDSGSIVPGVNYSPCEMGHILDLTVEAYDTLHSRENHDSLTQLKCSSGIETLEGNPDNLDDINKSRMLTFDEVTMNNQLSEMPANSMPGDKEVDLKVNPKLDCKNERSTALHNTSGSTTANFGKELLTPLQNHNVEDAEENGIVSGLRMPGTSCNEEDGRSMELPSSKNKENWMQKNFHEFEPLVKSMGVGFRDNYVSAREKRNHELDSKTDMSQLAFDFDGHELEWMKDESLREIVFKVRDNELSGRDPFHLMDDEDKHIFFSGLEKKVEQENKKLLKLHEYFHENIENLDYGADGISLYDPPEKIIPRWKVPPAEKNPEFLSNFVEQRKAFVSESLENSSLTKNNGKSSVGKLAEPSSHDGNPVVAEVTRQSMKFREKPAARSKTIIEGSDGSVRVGKKSGREYWQHTKKWSQGFLESYNSETNPEAKAAMTEIGKDLDRWITEKEIKEAADFLDKLPEKGQKLIQEKLAKVRREMELFGPQAVVSKYREYADESEDDYLWWLDLPYVLCIEMYTIENGEQKVGLYSLEMAADLELDPKQYHVIAFEDARDCNNLCYIIQAHLEMLGNGSAFVVARPPKDAFREAKANGFSVTVIRKGQLQMNVDQTLEEVDELIVEIGSKMYHDKVMRDRSVDMKGLMKGVFGISKPSRKRSNKKLKRHIKP